MTISENLVPFTSVLLQDMISTPEMRRVWSEEGMIRSWMAVEKAITEAQAEMGIVPRAAAAEIVAKLSPGHLPLAEVKKHADDTGHLMVAFLRTFREVCGPAAEHFHLGPTTQDILDTGLTLQMQEAHAIVLRQARELESVLCGRALEHKDTVMMGRTHEQHAVPLTLGFVLAGWAWEAYDQIERALEAEPRWRRGCLSGAVGAQNAFVELCGVEGARRLEAAVCARLSLGVPLADLHPRTDRFAEVVSNLAGFCGVVAKICLNLRSWQRPEVLEVEEAAGEKVCSSSTMPNKVNPEAAERTEGLARLARCLALAMQDIRMADHRDSTRMPVEFVSIPLVYMLTSRALATAVRVIERLIVHPDIMKANLDHPNVLGQAAGERLMIALYRKTGNKDEAHRRLQRLSYISRSQKRNLAEVVLEDESLNTHFSPEELDRLMDLTTYAGTAALQTEQVVAFIRRNREARAATAAGEAVFTR
ncbi:MAG: hypothetical protein KIT09_14820 [Bryobacteraceae bacterium]|nr:hypothetical protein [Bryobacteraceae bacterium]